MTDASLRICEKVKTSVLRTLREKESIMSLSVGPKVKVFLKNCPKNIWQEWMMNGILLKKKYTSTITCGSLIQLKLNFTSG